MEEALDYSKDSHEGQHIWSNPTTCPPGALSDPQTTHHLRLRPLENETMDIISELAQALSSR